MSQNSSNNTAKDPKATPAKRTYSWQFIIGLVLWVLFGFVIAQFLIVGIVSGLDHFGVSFTGISQTFKDTLLAVCVYLLTLLIVIGVPWLARKRMTNSKELGLTRLVSWLDIGLAPAGFIIYFLISAMLIYLVTQFIPGFDSEQVQSIGFDNLSYQYEYLLAFVTLVIIAPVAEEVLFRGYLYGKLRKSAPIWLAVILTSALFGFIHGQWNVGIDVFALSVVMCGLREITGSIWSGIILHMMKNGLAFYLLFINPTLLNTIGG